MSAPTAFLLKHGPSGRRPWPALLPRNVIVGDVHWHADRLTREYGALHDAERPSSGAKWLSHLSPAFLPRRKRGESDVRTRSAQLGRVLAYLRAVRFSGGQMPQRLGDVPLWVRVDLGQLYGDRPTGLKRALALHHVFSRPEP